MRPCDLELYFHPFGGFGVFVQGIESREIEANLGGYATPEEAIEAGHNWAEANFHKVIDVIQPD